VLGGDDLTVIVRANEALAFVETWLRSFEQETYSRRQHLGGAGLHAGAGIAMVNRGYPFSMAYEIAEDACRAAKKIEPVGKRRDASALRFRRITTALADEDRKGTTWELGSIKGLRTLVEAVEALPRGTMRSWLGLVDAGEAREAERNALWERAREVTEKKKWEAFAAVLGAVGANPKTGMFNAPATDTPLRDALVLVHLGRTRRKPKSSAQGKEEARS